MKRHQESETRPVAYDTARKTMSHYGMKPAWTVDSAGNMHWNVFDLLLICNSHIYLFVSPACGITLGVAVSANQ